MERIFLGEITKYEPCDLNFREEEEETTMDKTSVKTKYNSRFPNLQI